MDVSVILPTFNEQECLGPLAPRLDEAVRPWSHEVIVVDDDSPDGTGALVAGFAPDRGWRLITRKGVRGLSGAVLVGFGAARGQVLLVMDADGSHPPETVPKLVRAILDEGADVAVASRFVPGGSDLGLHGVRRAVSWGATRLARPLTQVRDPMSGFFAVRRELVDGVGLTPVGYKIGLEVLVKCRPKQVKEVPFVFGGRIAGTSKLGSRQVFAYVVHIFRLYRWRFFGPGRASRTR